MEDKDNLMEKRDEGPDKTKLLRLKRITFANSYQEELPGCEAGWMTNSVYSAGLESIRVHLVERRRHLLSTAPTLSDNYEDSNDLLPRLCDRMNLLAPSKTAT